jgi:alkaline phosphatase
MARSLHLEVKFVLMSLAWLALATLASAEDHGQAGKTGSVIFIHPDGSGASSWAALRLLDVGPDGSLNWDRMERLGLYRGHLANSAVSSSNGGATAHAFGIKARHKAFGSHPARPLTALSGSDRSVLLEARDAGLGTALINTGHIGEPGTAAFVANSRLRTDTDTIAVQVVRSGVDILLSGGETLLLPEGVTGRFGEAGVRKDGLDVIELARGLGYVVVYTRDELLALPDTTRRVLGVFAPFHTFHDMAEESLRVKGLPIYLESAPTAAEMLTKALALLSARDRPFLVVLEEEGTDNFANDNNAAGTLEALRRADAAIGVALGHIRRHPDTLLLTAADSEAGGMDVVPVPETSLSSQLKPWDGNGAPWDGVDGRGTAPFESAPDRFGTRHRFGICWASADDLGGGVVARAHGLHAERLPAATDNTDIYRMMHLALFGRWLPADPPAQP